MNPRLYIMKMRNQKEYYSDRKNIHFTVIDSDTRKKYPSNFICVLPQRISIKAGQTSVFAKTFGDKRLEIAKKLLTQALKTEEDIEIKTEISQRLKLLTPKPAIQAKCMH